MASSASLTDAVRTLLTDTPASALPLTYQQVATALELKPPRTIARVTQALEALMHEDAASGRPFIAALVVSRRDAMPGQGFFELARTLERFPLDPSLQQDAYRNEFAQALANR
ncbi:hypothetical protein [Halomonas sp. GD1P12]|uniref:hypothetical protein n=1 Tax=Halomonas sp. GD1P12 TaxID=2982691 RepID=UPI0021E44EEC|nr:hypothetical protein [Halomonas sp. GD1P12]UYF98907.1 hypothetical protein OCT39_11795 [Halomonas sp. GD1P12]